MIPTVRFVQAFFTFSLVGAVLAVLSGCSDIRYDALNSVPDQKEPRVKVVQFAHAIHFGSSDVNMSVADSERLAAFLDGIGIGNGDRVYVAGERAPKDQTLDIQLANLRRDTVMKHLTQRGVKATVVTADLGDETPVKGAVKVIVRRHIVTLPGCPDWTGGPGTYTNTVSRNWGCTTATNLGLMVADPQDLAVGRDPDIADGDYLATSIDRYRKGKTKQITNVNAGAFALEQTKQKDSGGDTQ
jgi:pilus assembly protein CpaD